MLRRLYKPCSVGNFVRYGLYLKVVGGKNVVFAGEESKIPNYRTSKTGVSLI